jgi:hypothetical protein
MADSSNDARVSAPVVAYRLLEHIMRVENRTTENPRPGDMKRADRRYLLDTYAECLNAVVGQREVTRPAAAAPAKPEPQPLKREPVPSRLAPREGAWRSPVADERR